MKKKIKKEAAAKVKRNIGWREWVSLPELGVSKIKAKIDTGARTSAIDAEVHDVKEENGIQKVCFDIFFDRDGKRQKQSCEAKLIEYRNITNSGGYESKRVVIETDVIIGDHKRKIEVSLAPRAKMKFRMLLGRTALRDSYRVVSNSSFLTSSSPNEK